jgi:hypothetical protein
MRIHNSVLYNQYGLSKYFRQALSLASSPLQFNIRVPIAAVRSCASITPTRSARSRTSPAAGILDIPADSARKEAGYRALSYRCPSPSTTARSGSIRTLTEGRERREVDAAQLKGILGTQLGVKLASILLPPQSPSGTTFARRMLLFCNGSLSFLTYPLIAFLANACEHRCQRLAGFRG